jgi:hypothetical protein
MFDRPPADPWQRATFEGAERETLRAGARLTLPERFEWLEAAADHAARLRESRSRREPVVEAPSHPLSPPAGSSPD